MSPTAEKVARTDAGLASSLRFSVNRLSRRMRTEDLDDTGVSVGGLSVLARLFRDGQSSIGQLAAAERVQPPSMTRTVSCLEAEGLVERAPHPTDGRQVIIRLSEAGEAVLVAERRRRDAWLMPRLRELTPDERALLRQAAPILERLSNS
ncbi:MarR family transcriptional regulator [Nocardioides sp. HDW12B]|uniref:MarR family winged helix-turn-helix transcriptional regulator n=1 Tax=Nocardioides sp. HDW12B TaxID=2714939 RepID=UPI001F0EF8C1|nr:MarR family transcriptional regulator [Nocardioides sp. HDW12B]